MVRQQQLLAHYFDTELMASFVPGGSVTVDVRQFGLPREVVFNILIGYRWSWHIEEHAPERFTFTEILSPQVQELLKGLQTSNRVRMRFILQRMDLDYVSGPNAILKMFSLPLAAKLLGLRYHMESVIQEIDTEYAQLCASLPENATDRDFGLCIRSSKYPGLHSRRRYGHIEGAQDYFQKAPIDAILRVLDIPVVEIVGDGDGDLD
jgi:hypothetical protein